MNTQHHATPQPATPEFAWTPPPRQHVLIEEINSKPVWSLIDLNLLLDIPVSTLNEIVRDNPAPFFLLGRRKVIFREDALTWLREVADRNPWSPRTNTRTPQK